MTAKSVFSSTIAVGGKSFMSCRKRNGKSIQKMSVNHLLKILDGTDMNTVKKLGILVL